MVDAPVGSLLGGLKVLTSGENKFHDVHPAGPGPNRAKPAEVFVFTGRGRAGGGGRLDGGGRPET